MVASVSIALLAAQVGAEYDEPRAVAYAYLSTAAMCSYPHLSDNSLLEKWACGPPCDAVSNFTDVFAINSGDSNDAFTFGGKWNGECTIVFRGTSDLDGWIQDLKSADLVDITAQGVSCSYNKQPCQVGDGFMRNYNSLSTMLKGNLSKIGCDTDQPLFVTGHSLGAAEAAIAMFDLKNQGYTIAQSYTFGQPRVGDSTFASAFEKEFASTEPWRITHASDPVPHLPFENMGFTHMTTEVYYKGKVSEGFKKCDSSGEDPSCANSHSAEVPISILTCAASKDRCDHLDYMTASKTSLMTGDDCAGKSVHV